MITKLLKSFGKWQMLVKAMDSWFSLWCFTHCQVQRGINAV